MTSRSGPSRIFVLGPDLPFVDDLADALGGYRDIRDPHDTAVIVWSPEEFASPPAEDADLLEDCLLAGCRRYGKVLGSAAGQPPRRIVHIVQAEAESPLLSTVRSVVAGFTRSWARELARHATTVNAVGYAASSPVPVDALVAAVRYFADDLSGYTTGQTLGSVGQRLARPHPESPITEVRPGTVLVSGGAGAIGAAIVRRLHADGQRVVIGYLRAGAAQELCREVDPTGRSCVAIPLDVTDAAAIARVTDDLAKTENLTGLVLCGGWNRTAHFANTEPAEWHKTLAINLTGPVRLLAALAPELQTVGGRIVGIGSESGRVGDAGRSVYAGAKAGLARLLSDLQQSRAGLRCLTVSPGPVDTPLMRSTHGDPARAQQGIEALRRLVPLRRLGLPEEIAHGVGFAFTDGGGCLNGEVLSIGGGVSMQ